MKGGRGCEVGDWGFTSMQKCSKSTTDNTSNKPAHDDWVYLERKLLYYFCLPVQRESNLIKRFQSFLFQMENSLFLGVSKFR